MIRYRITVIVEEYLPDSEKFLMLYKKVRCENTYPKQIGWRIPQYDGVSKQ